MDLMRWKLFRDLDSSLVSTCKIAKIIDHPKVGFLVLQNDDVYAVADSVKNFKWLGNGINFAGADVCQAAKIYSLCGKGIINFYGNTCSFGALTEDGCVYSWESNEECNADVDGVPRKVLCPDDNRAQVNQVAAGLYHTLCLTSEGVVFGWGDDDLGQLGSGLKRGRGYQVTKISGFDDRIVQVAAGIDTSYALDSLGRVWSWGTGDSSSLGYEAPDDQLTPKLIDSLPKITKIAVGDHHVLALSETGELYFWGKFENDHNSDADVITIKPLLTKIREDVLEPVIDIASTGGANYAVCQSKNKVYLFGILFKQRISTPVETEFSSMEEVFACAESPIMLQAFRVKALSRRVVEAWKRGFNDSSTADVLFSLANDVLHAHSAFLKLRSDYFRSMFDNGWQESKNESKAIEIQGFSFRTFKAFMYFLYCESLIQPDMSVDDLTELMKAADYYGEDDLRLACEDKLKTKLTPENACFVYACSAKSNAKNLQDYAVEYMVPVYREVVNSEECKKMDSDLKSKLMVRFADFHVFQVSKKSKFV